MNAETIKVMKRIVELNDEINELEDKLCKMLGLPGRPKTIGELTEKKVDVNSFYPSELTKNNESNDLISLSEMGLSENALEILRKDNLIYFYDVEDGISMRHIMKICGNDFKAYNEIVATFKDYGIDIIDDVNKDISSDIKPVPKKPLAEKYTKEPYNINIMDLKIDKRICNALVRCGYNTVYDIYKTPKKALLASKANGHNGIGYKGYKQIYTYFKDILKVHLEPVENKKVKIKDAKW